MTLHYSFEGDVEVIDSASAHINNGWYEPHYHTEHCDDIEYEYEVDPTEDDFLDYLAPDFRFMEKFKDLPKEQIKLLQQGAEEAIRLILGSYEDLKDWIEEEDEFVEFMTERYEDDARQAFEEEYE